MKRNLTIYSFIKNVNQFLREVINIHNYFLYNHQLQLMITFFNDFYFYISINI